MKIPFGMLEEYKKYVSEHINRIKEKDSGTLQFDWFISSDKTDVLKVPVYMQDGERSIPRILK